MAGMNPISATLCQVLSFIDGIIGNYGVSVIVFTLLVRLVLLPLNIKSKKSMKAMERVRPQLQALEKKYAQDKEKYQQKMTELYQKEKINPMSGCLPMLATLPILFCMFTAMRVVANEKTVEMLLGMMNGVAPEFDRFLWITNIFQPDAFWATVIPRHGSSLMSLVAVSGSEVLTPENVEAVTAFLSSDAYLEWTARYGADTIRYAAPLLMGRIEIPMQFNGLFLLPILSMASQFLMTKLQPQAAAGQTEQQQAQGKMMQYFFPLFSLWICATSTSAFALYWVASNVIEILQTFVLNVYFNRLEKKEKQIKEA